MTTIRTASLRILPLHITLAAVIITLAITGSACHSSKSGASGNGLPQALEVTTAPVETLFYSLAESYKPWTDLYVPVTLALESPKRMSISGRATMIYGQQIYISLRMIGMEVGVIYVDQSSIYVIDKFHKAYFTQDLGPLFSRLGISIADLQDLLLGRPVIPGKGIITVDDSDAFTFLTSGAQWLLTPQEKFPGAEWHYIAQRTDPPLLSGASLRIKDGLAVACGFSEPAATTAGIVDAMVTLTLPYKNEEITLSLNWGIDDAKWDTDREVKFSAPSDSYRRLDVNALLKSIDNF